jgi:hypothetical protein
MMLNSESLSLEQLITLHPEQIWIEMSDDDRATAQQETTAHRYSNDTARDRAFHNALCLNAIAHFLAEDPDLPPAQAWLPAPDRPPVWELVNGSILTVGTTRLAIVPVESDRFEALKVEQEWIDIPDWAAHYYLGVQLNLEANWLRIVGYATHDQLKHSENFSAQERVYCLSRSQLIEDLNVMWMAREVSPDWNPIVPPLPELSNATDLIEQLAQVTAYSPRLERSFAEWAALVANPHWRRSLQQRRLEYGSPIAHLSRWLQQNLLEPGWQTIRDLGAFQGVAIARASHTEGQPRTQQAVEQAITLGNQALKLMVFCETIEASSDLRTVIAVQHLNDTPLSDTLYLTFMERDATGAVTQSKTQALLAGSPDRILKLPRFRASAESRFTIRLSLGDFQVQQDFLV